MTERDWEAAARKRLEATVTNVTESLQRMAANIGQQAASGIRAAATEATDYSTYTRVAERVVHEVVWGVANLNLANVIDAAADAHAAHVEKMTTEVLAARPDKGSRAALQTLLDVAEGWAQTAHENDMAMDRQDVKEPEEQQFTIHDIRVMLNDAAREIGVAPVWQS